MSHLNLLRQGDRFKLGIFAANCSNGMSEAGFGGTTLSFVNYVDEFPYFRDAVMPLLRQRGTIA